METMICIIDSHHGVYVPQCFAEVNPYLSRWNLDEYADEYAILLAGPEHSEYWEAWDVILNNAFLISKRTGETWTLHQDDDLFMVSESHEWEE